MPDKCECSSWCIAEPLDFLPLHHPNCSHHDDSLIDVACITVGRSRCYDDDIDVMRKWSEEMTADGEDNTFLIVKMHKEKFEQMNEFNGF